MVRNYSGDRDGKMLKALEKLHVATYSMLQREVGFSAGKLSRGLRSLLLSQSIIHSEHLYSLSKYRSEFEEQLEQRRHHRVSWEHITTIISGLLSLYDPLRAKSVQGVAPDPNYQKRAVMHLMSYPDLCGDIVDMVKWNEKKTNATKCLVDLIRAKLPRTIHVNDMVLESLNIRLKSARPENLVRVEPESGNSPKRKKNHLVRIDEHVVATGKTFIQSENIKRKLLRLISVVSRSKEYRSCDGEFWLARNEVERSRAEFNTKAEVLANRLADRIQGLDGKCYICDGIDERISEGTERALNVLVPKIRNIY